MRIFPVLRQGSGLRLAARGAKPALGAFLLAVAAVPAVQALPASVLDTGVNKTSAAVNATGSATNATASATNATGSATNATASASTATATIITTNTISASTISTSTNINRNPDARAGSIDSDAVAVFYRKTRAAFGAFDPPSSGLLAAGGMLGLLIARRRQQRHSL